LRGRGTPTSFFDTWFFVNRESASGFFEWCVIEPEEAWENLGMNNGMAAFCLSSV
jgi:hypothetical protein